MGAGRVIYQELTRIGKAIEGGEFERNPMLDEIFSYLKDKGSALHLMGLLSDGGVHSHISHLFAILEAAKKKGLTKVFVHAFLDGRDTPPSSGVHYMESLVSEIRKTGVGKVATVSGRFFAMDRDNRWDRVEKAYNAIVKGEGRTAEDQVLAIKGAYSNGETDEFVSPTVIVENGSPAGKVEENDAVFFFNFRADRAREITRAFVDREFDGFERGPRPALVSFICMTEYDQKLNLPVLFKPQDIKNILGEVLSKAGLKQFRVSETEKYAHVTFFFNGGKETLPVEHHSEIVRNPPVDTITDVAPHSVVKLLVAFPAKKRCDGHRREISQEKAQGDIVPSVLPEYEPSSPLLLHTLPRSRGRDFHVHIRELRFVPSKGVGGSTGAGFLHSPEHPCGTPAGQLNHSFPNLLSPGPGAHVREPSGQIASRSIELISYNYAIAAEEPRFPKVQ